MEIQDEKWTRWKIKRRRTFIGYIIVGTIVGMDYAFMFNTLYSYLKDMVKTKHPHLFYGIIIASYSLASTVFGIVFGRWVDKTRKIKRYTTIITLIQIVGSLIYAIPCNVYFPLVGRILCGLGDPFASVVSGEIVRIYDNKDAARALWWLASVYGIGQIISPGFLLLFYRVDFNIFSFHVTRLNAIPIFLAFLLTISLFVIFVFVNDCSAEIDLKKHLYDKNRSKKDQQNLYEDIKPLLLATQNEKEDMEQQKRLDEESKHDFYTPPIKIILKAFLYNVDPVLMLISTSLFMYNAFSADVLLPLITLNILKLTLNMLTIMMIVYGTAILLFYLLMSKYCTGDTAIFSMALISIFMQIFLYGIMIFIKTSSRDKTRDIVVISVYVVCFSIAWLIEEVLIRCMLAKMVPSNCQSFTETVRNGCSRTSTVIAAFTAPLVIPFLQWWSLVMMIVTFVFLICFFSRRNQLRDIKQIHIGDD